VIAQSNQYVQFSKLSHSVSVEKPHNERLQRISFVGRQVMPWFGTARCVDLLHVMLNAGTRATNVRVVHKGWKRVGATRETHWDIPIDTVVSMGMDNGTPQYSLLISAFRMQTRDGISELWLADTVECWYQVQPVVTNKNVDNAQNEAPFNSWFRSQSPYAILHTAASGAAFTTGADVLAAQPTLRGVATEKLQLYYRGVEEPCLIWNDAVNGFSDDDTIVFVGKRPTGTTSFLNPFDTVSAYVLGVVENTGTRFQEYPTYSGPTEEQTTVRINERFELDTGYYFEGYSSDPVTSLYVTDDVPNEGFYWAYFNASVTDRASPSRKQSIRFRTLPTPEGQPLTVVTSLLRTSDAPMVRNEHVMAVGVDGSGLQQVEGDSVGMDHVVAVINPLGVSPVEHRIDIYSIGQQNEVGKPGYTSEQMLSHVTAQGNVLPLLHQGSVFARFPASTKGTVVRWNANATASAVLIDTTLGAARRVQGNQTATTILSSCKQSAMWWVDEPAAGLPYDVAMQVGDREVTVDSVQACALLWFDGDGFQFRRGQPSNVREWFRSLPEGAAYTLLSVQQGVQNDIQDLLRARGAQGSAETATWIATGVVGGQGRFSDVSQNQPTGIRIQSTLDGVAEYQVETVVLPRQDSATVLVCGIGAMERARVREARMVHLSETMPPTADIISIVHDEFLDQAQRLAQHRFNQDSLTTWVVPYSAVRDEFACGERGPFTLRQFLVEVYNRMSPKPHYAILFGGASWDPRMIAKGGNVVARRPDFIPTYGKPSSDYWFGLLDSPLDIAQPELVVGRLPAITVAEAEIMVNKVIAHDQAPQAPWHRTWMYVGGGAERDGFCDYFRYILDDTFETGILYTNPPLCFDTISVCGMDYANPGLPIRSSLTNGVYVTNFLGHGAVNVFDVSGWDAAELPSTNKFGVLATFACQTNAFSTPSAQCKNAEYITEPDAGFAATMGGSGFELIIYASFMQAELPRVVANSPFRSIGDVMYHTKRGIALRADPDGINSVMQINLLGDPSMRLRIDTVPSPYLRPEDVRVMSIRGNEQYTSLDSTVSVSVTLQNAGLGSNAPLRIEFEHRYESSLERYDTVIAGGMCASQTVRWELPIFNKGGEHTITISIPTQDQYQKTSDNTTFTRSFSVSTESIVPITPNFGVVPTNNAIIRVATTHPDAQHRSYSVYTAEWPSADRITAAIPGSSLTRTKNILQISLETVAEGKPTWVLIREQAHSTITTEKWLCVTGVSGGHNDSSLIVWPSSALHNIPDGIVVDSATRRVQLGTREKSIVAVSSSSPPKVIIKVGEVEYRNSSFLRGFHVAVLSAFDTIPRALRWYDTNENPFPRSDDMNGYAEDLILFLRDSVATSETIVVALSEGAISGVATSELQQLADVLGGFGAVDIAKLRHGDAYAFIGSRQNPGASREQFRQGNNTATVSEIVSFMVPSARIMLPIIGPARGFMPFALGPEGDAVLQGLAGETEASLQPVDVQQPIDASRVLLQATIDARLGKPFVTTITGQQQELAEIALWSLVDTVSVLRGDDLTLSATIWNVRLATAIDSCSVAFAVLDSLGSTVTDTVVRVGFLAPDQRIEATWQVNSASLPTRGTCVARLITGSDEQTRYDLEPGNNSASTTCVILPDGESPRVSVIVAGLEANPTVSTVLAEPEIVINLLDNAKLPIATDQRFLIFVNGTRIRESVVASYQFFGTAELAEQHPLVAQIRFRYPLELGQNNITIKATDASGNPVDYNAVVLRQQGSILQMLPVFPNPSTTGVSIPLRYQTDVANAQVKVGVYGIDGTTVFEQTTQADGFESTIVWDGAAATQASVAPGVYAIRCALVDALGAPIKQVSTLITLLR
jgi:hypothetical protein